METVSRTEIDEILLELRNEATRKRINHAGQTGGKDSRRETIPPSSGGGKKTQPREPERKRDPDRLRRKRAYK